jgi:hypothetical protein
MCIPYIRIELVVNICVGETQRANWSLEMYQIIRLI